MSAVDPVLLRVYQNMLDAIAEEMGSALERTGFSPNIKERRDYSCAIFDASGQMVAHAAHIPVHLGSTPRSVAAAMESHTFKPGDAVILNDPYRGGTHLPDLTVVSAVFESERSTPSFYVANRAHHADVGGSVRGSMGLFTEIFQEGLRIPPVLIRRGGEPVQETEALLFANMRQPEERRGDLRAQLNANRVGEQGLLRLLEGDRDELIAYCGHLQDAAEQHVRRLLASIPDGCHEAEEFMEDDGVGTEDIRIRVRIDITEDRCVFDFNGTDAQVPGCINCNPAIVVSAIFYVLRTLAGGHSGSDIPANAGCLRPVEVKVPRGSLLDPNPPGAVAGGNVETSQRLVDTLYRAFAAALPERIPAQSQGTMNNWCVGAHRHNGASFSYYETVGGGTGAGSWGHGVSAIHSHMTNTRNTPIESLEHAIPVRVTEYSVRRDSKGQGRHVGGDGIVREIEALEPMQASLLAERRRRRPSGLDGGQPGAAGNSWLIQGDERTALPAKWQGWLEAGDRLRLETPGGGGAGASP